MKISVTQGDITKVKADAIVVNLFEGVKKPGGATGAVDAATGGAITHAIKAGDLKGKEGTAIVLYPGKGLGAPRVVVVGLGKQKDFTNESVRRAAGTAYKALKGTGAKDVATIVHGAGIGGLDPAECARDTAGATISVSFRFTRKGTKSDSDDERAPGKLIIVEHDAPVLAAVRKGVKRGVAVAESQNVARHFSTISGDEAAPAAIANAVKKMASEVGLKCTVLGPAQIKRERMGGLMCIAQGSAKEARFVVLEHKPPKAKRTIVLVGKGVTFDTGGISLKPGADMDKMKYDKSGAAAVYGTMRAVALLGLPIHVVGLTPLVENMPSGTAVKPGDIITMRSGKTVEMLNTDAEGRMVLADALDYANVFDPDHTIDLATLTGAVSIAVGTQAIGLMSNDDRLTAKLKAAGEATRERVWELPFYEEYGKQIESSVADIKNIGGRNAGTITAGKFLEHFAPKSWVHLDIASTAWNDAQPHLNGAYYPAGSTGVGVRLLTRFLSDGA